MQIQTAAICQMFVFLNFDISISNLFRDSDFGFMFFMFGCGLSTLGL